MLDVRRGDVVVVAAASLAHARTRKGFRDIPPRLKGNYRGIVTATDVGYRGTQVRVAVTFLDDGHIIRTGHVELRPMVLRPDPDWDPVHYRKPEPSPSQPVSLAATSDDWRRATPEEQLFSDALAQLAG